MPKITKRVVDGAQPDPGRRFTIWDTEIKGFGLLVLPSGVKSYVYQYRTAEGGRGVRPSASMAPSRLTRLAPKPKRVAGGRWRRRPLDEKRERGNAATVAEVLEAYLASEAFPARRHDPSDRQGPHPSASAPAARASVRSMPSHRERHRTGSRGHPRRQDGEDEKMGRRALPVSRGGDGAARKCDSPAAQPSWPGRSARG